MARAPPVFAGLVATGCSTIAGSGRGGREAKARPRPGGQLARTARVWKYIPNPRAALNKSTKDLLVASLAVGAIAVALYFAIGARSPKINSDPYEVLGSIAAEE